MSSTVRDTKAGETTDKTDMVYLDGGQFSMGSDDYYPEERPVEKVQVDGFWIDKYAVTNEKFAEFVNQTNYNPNQCEMIRSIIVDVVWIRD